MDFSWKLYDPWGNHVADASSTDERCKAAKAHLAATDHAYVRCVRNHGDVTVYERKHIGPGDKVEFKAQAEGMRSYGIAKVERIVAHGERYILLLEDRAWCYTTEVLQVFPETT